MSYGGVAGIQIVKVEKMAVAMVVGRGEAYGGDSRGGGGGVGGWDWEGGW
jgi:hypothetical protein